MTILERLRQLEKQRTTPGVGLSYLELGVVADALPALLRVVEAGGDVAASPGLISACVSLADALAELEKPA
jgi:hypothetical protein